MIDTIPKLARDFAANNPDLTIQMAKDNQGAFQPIDWKTFYTGVQTYAAGLIDIGVKRGDHVGIISDNCSEWLISSFAIMSIGAADVPRGSDTMAGEIAYILEHAECTVSVAEDQSQCEKILSKKDILPRLKTLIVIDKNFDRGSVQAQGVDILTYNEVLERGKALLQAHPGCVDEEIDQGGGEDLASLIYTSGTTGEPKGVMLIQSNFMHQWKAPRSAIDVRRGDVFISVLPVWHSYERSLEYVAVFHGACLAYSKLIPQILLQDIPKIRPVIFPSVPRIWEGLRTSILRKFNESGGLKTALAHFFIKVGTSHYKLKVRFRGLIPQFKKRAVFLDTLAALIPLLLITPLNALGQVLVFSKVKKFLGGRFRFGVSGSAALPPHVDEFFAAAGILLLEGYGLTETSPIVSVRNFWKPVPGTIGRPVDEVEVKVVDEQGRTLPPGQKGVLYIKGPNIMKGYYKNPEMTAQIIDAEGWLNSGDLAMLSHKGEIKILGRVKETIVLMGGENVEPGPIEDTIAESMYIDNAMVVGDDQKFLAALIVPNLPNLETCARENNISYEKPEDLTKDSRINRMIMDEVNELISPKRGFRLFERINQIHLIPKPFEKGVELSHTLKVKRNVINEMYAQEIADLFKVRR